MCRCLPIILFIDEGEKESEKLKGEEEEEYERRNFTLQQLHGCAQIAVLNPEYCRPTFPQWSCENSIVFLSIIKSLNVLSSILFVEQHCLPGRQLKVTSPSCYPTPAFKNKTAARIPPFFFFVFLSITIFLEAIIYVLVTSASSQNVT